MRSSSLLIYCSTLILPLLLVEAKGEEHYYYHGEKITIKESEERGMFPIRVRKLSSFDL